MASSYRRSTLDQHSRFIEDVQPSNCRYFISGCDSYFNMRVLCVVWCNLPLKVLETFLVRAEPRGRASSLGVHSACVCNKQTWGEFRRQLHFVMLGKRPSDLLRLPQTILYNLKNLQRGNTDRCVCVFVVSLSLSRKARRVSVFELTETGRVALNRRD